MMRWFPVSIVYLDRDVEGKTVYASCSGCGFEDALNNILGGTSLTWVRMGNQVILKPLVAEPSRPMATVYGTVTDSVTGEWIAGATVVARSATDEAVPASLRWCPSNPYGFYSLRNLSPGPYLITVRAVGYRPLEVRVEVPPSGPVWMDFPMVSEEITMQEVTVEGYRAELTSAGAFSRGIYIRSGPSDQNQYFLDGARIYNPSHFGGVLSSVSDEVLNDVQVMVDGMPPYYGGRIGGILDLSMRDGTTERLSGSAGTGSLGSQLSLEGPLGGSTSFLVSGRRAYPNAQVPFLREDGVPSRLGSSEVTAKLSHRLSTSSRLFLNGYWGSDSYDNRVEHHDMKLSNNLGWGNRMLNLRWIGIASPSLFLHASAAYSRYGLSLEHALSGDPFPGLESGLPRSSDFAIEDLTLRAQAEHYYDEEHTVLGGAELIRHRMDGYISTFSNQISPMSFVRTPIWEFSVYLQDQWRILPRVMAQLGVRATTYTGEQGSFSAVDPRFALQVSLSDQARLYGTLTSVSQFLHPYRSSGIFLFYPANFWYSSTEQIKPTTSMHMTVGFGQGFGDDTYHLSVESFYRVTNNLHEFMADSLYPFSSAPGSLKLENNALTGTGKLYGVEISFRKRLGGLTGMVAYTYSWERHTFDELNGGRPFIPRFSRRHELGADIWFHGRGGWSVGALCVLALTDSWRSMEDGVTASAAPNDGLGPGRGGYDPLPIFDLSQSRFPGFQRLEFNIVRTFALWDVSGQLTLRLLNAYGLLDPFSWNLDMTPDPRLKWTAKVKPLRLFPLYPTLSLMVRF
jgi:hypothetical protein